MRITSRTSCIPVFEFHHTSNSLAQRDIVKKPIRCILQEKTTSTSKNTRLLSYFNSRVDTVVISSGFMSPDPFEMYLMCDANNDGIINLEDGINFLQVVSGVL